MPGLDSFNPVNFSRSSPSPSLPLPNSSFSYLGVAAKAAACVAVIFTIAAAIYFAVKNGFFSLESRAGPHSPPADEPPSTSPAVPELSESTLHLRAAQQKLEEGIEISEGLIAEIREITPDMANSRLNPKIVHSEIKNCFFVFSLASHPELIFEMHRNLLGRDLLNTSFANTIKAVGICEVERLDLLVIPRMKMFTVDGKRVIAKERLNFIANDETQKTFWNRLPGLEEARRQLTILISKMDGFSAEVPPILDTALDFAGNRKIAIIDRLTNQTDSRRDAERLLKNIESRLGSSSSSSSWVGSSSFPSIDPSSSSTSIGSSPNWIWPELFEARQKLEEGIDITDGLVGEIQELMPDIVNAKENSRIGSFIKFDEILTFSLTSHPRLIFKTMDDKRSASSAQSSHPERKICLYFANAARAVKSCDDHKLTLLVIPRMKAFEICGKTFIAQELPTRDIDVASNKTAQKELYQTLTGLDEAIRQLTIFIIETGYSEVSCQNMPILDVRLDFEGNRRIALVDNFQYMGDASKGLFGIYDYFGNASSYRGLIGCLYSESHIAFVLEKAKSIKCFYASDAINKQKELIAKNQAIRDFYTRKGILENPRQPIAANVEDLGLDLEEASSATTMRETAQRVIDLINEEIAKNSDEVSVQAKRLVILRKESLSDYYQLPAGWVREEKEQWISQIIDALKKADYICSFDRISSSHYIIQA